MGLYCAIDQVEHLHTADSVWCDSVVYRTVFAHVNHPLDRLLAFSSFGVVAYEDTAQLDGFIESSLAVRIDKNKNLALPRSGCGP